MSYELKNRNFSGLGELIGLKNSFSISQSSDTRWPKDLKTCIDRSNLFKGLRAYLLEEGESSESNGSTFGELKSPVFPTTFGESSGSTFGKEIKTLLHDLEGHTRDLEPLLRESSPTEMEGYSQVCFQGTPWNGLNSIPFALAFLSLYKTYLIPTLGIMIPIITWILPYILLKLFYKVPMGFSEYSGVLMKMISSNGSDADLTSQIRKYTQTAGTLFTLVQAMYQPFQQARHFHKLDKNCLVLAEKIIEVKRISEKLSRKVSKWLPGWLPAWIKECPEDKRQAFAFVIDTPFWLHHTLRAIGRFEVLYSLASSEHVNPVDFIQQEQGSVKQGPILLLKDFGDPSIPVERRVLSSISLGKKEQNHALLTGPNRGGKSSFLRGISQNIELAHTFGCVFARKGQMSYFSWIANGLELSDNPGKQSMFEREVAFASSVLKMKKSKGNGIVLYDELFHSTNPPDASRSSKAFCSKLWKKSSCLSVLSTHDYSLAEESSEKDVKRVCVASWFENSEYTFSYTVKKGICKVSSVDLLLKQFGLL